MSGHDDTRRKVVHATICAPAAETLRAFCIGHGVTVTAFLDGLGHVLAGSSETPAVMAALEYARIIDADRRNRERPSSCGPGASAADLLGL